MVALGLVGHIVVVDLVVRIALVVEDCREQHKGEEHLYQFAADENKTMPDLPR